MDLWTRISGTRERNLLFSSLAIRYANQAAFKRGDPQGSIRGEVEVGDKVAGREELETVHGL